MRIRTSLVSTEIAFESSSCPPCSTIYNMCTQKPPADYSQQLYDRYRDVFEEYIRAMVLPALREKQQEFMLRELVGRWENQRIMVRWMTRFFNYLDRYFIARRQLLGLKEVGNICFRDLVRGRTGGGRAA